MQAPSSDGLYFLVMQFFSLFLLGASLASCFQPAFHVGLLVLSHPCYWFSFSASPMLHLPLCNYCWQWWLLHCSAPYSTTNPAIPLCRQAKMQYHTSVRKCLQLWQGKDLGIWCDLKKMEGEIERVSWNRGGRKVLGKNPGAKACCTSESEEFYWIKWP